MANSSFQIDLKTGRPLQSPVNIPVYKRCPIVKTRWQTDQNSSLVASASTYDGSPRVKEFLSERSERTKSIMGMGNNEKRFSKLPLLGIAGTREVVLTAPQLSVFDAPSPCKIAKTLSRVDSEQMHPKSVPEKSKHRHLENRRSQPKTVSAAPHSLFKPVETPSRVESERMRRKFVDETVKQRQSEQSRKKMAVDEHVKRMARRNQPVRRVTVTKKPYRPRSRSATFIVEKPSISRVTDRGDNNGAKKLRPPSKSVSSNVIRSSKMEDYQMGMVVLNKAARLRLERFGK